MRKTRNHSGITRPRYRAECAAGPRPCPWVSCRYHLYLDVNRETGAIKFNHPDRELWELEHTCALDLADAGELTFEQVGSTLNLTRERIRQVTVEGLERVSERLFPGEHAAARQDMPWMPSDSDIVR